jgi:hypothetical protein
MARPPLEPAGNTRHLAACFRSREITVETETAARPRQPASGFADS